MLNKFFETTNDFNFETEKKNFTEICSRETLISCFPIEP